MIKVTKVEVEKFHSDGHRDVLVELVSDTADEVSAIGTDGSTVVGLSSGDVMVMGSLCFTVEKDLGMLSSNGTWNFQ